jgi:cadmium resistance protein CadD (predicted permease)
MSAAGLVGAAAGAFTVTNLDDLVLLTALFAAGRVSGAPSRSAVAVGQAIGLAGIVITSAIVAAGLGAVPDELVAVLGLVPLGFGIRGLLALRRRPQDDRWVSPARSTGSIAAVTMSNGVDNISLYAP